MKIYCLILTFVFGLFHTGDCQKIKKIIIYAYNPYGGRGFPYKVNFNQGKEEVKLSIKEQKYENDKSAKQIILRKKSAISPFAKFLNYNINLCDSNQNNQLQPTIYIEFVLSSGTLYTLGLEDINSQLIVDSVGRIYKCNDELYRIIVEATKFSEGRFKDKKIKTASECGC